MAIGEVGEGDLRAIIYAGNTSTLVGARKQFQLARLQEFGTADMPANAFFYPSYRAVRRRIRGRITRGTKKAARAVASKA
jgi:hypothetical protein